MIYYNHKGFQHEILDPEILHHTKKLRKFCFIQAWLSFSQTRSRAQCCLIYSSISGVPCVCVNIAINVQRAQTPQYSAVWALPALISQLQNLPSSLVSVQFAESGSLWFRRDSQTSLRCHPTDLLNAMMPRFGSSCTSLLCKQPQNWLCTALDATWDSAKLKGILSAALLCWCCGECKNPQRCRAPASWGCSTANPGTATPVHDKTPKQWCPFPCFLVNNWFPHHLQIIKIWIYFTVMSNTGWNWYQTQTKSSWFSSGSAACYAWSPLCSAAIAESLCCSSGSPGRMVVTVCSRDSICSSVSLSSLSSTICRSKKKPKTPLASSNPHFLPQGEGLGSAGKTLSRHSLSSSQKHFTKQNSWNILKKKEKKKERKNSIVQHDNWHCVMRSWFPYSKENTTLGTAWLPLKPPSTSTSLSWVFPLAQMQPHFPDLSPKFLCFHGISWEEFPKPWHLIQDLQEIISP